MGRLSGPEAQEEILHAVQEEHRGKHKHEQATMSQDALHTPMFPAVNFYKKIEFAHYLLSQTHPERMILDRRGEQVLFLLPHSPILG